MLDCYFYCILLVLLGNKIIKCSCLRRMTYKVVWSCTCETPIGQDLFVCNLSHVFIFIFLAKLVIQPSYWRQLLHFYVYIPNHSKNFRKSSENHCWLKRVYFDLFQLHVDLPLSMLHLDLKVSSIIFLSVPFTEVQATTWASLVFACLFVMRLR